MNACMHGHSIENSVDNNDASVRMRKRGIYGYGGPFVSKFKCYIFIQITIHSSKMHTVFIQDVQFSFKIFINSTVLCSFIAWCSCFN